MTIKISGVIITNNEERNIEDCIQSINEVVDEIIVIDSFSSDNTRMICERLQVNFYQKEWEGYSQAKNFGNSVAKGSHILSIDADERLSDKLKKSIISCKSNLQGSYSFNRLNNYCGKWIKHSGWYPDRKIRIFPKTGSFWNENEIHEKLITDNPSNNTFLKGDLLHFSIDSIEQHVNKINYYTNIEALEAFKENKQVGFSEWVVSSFFKFFKIYFLKLGFLDGLHGFLIASFSAYSKFLKYSKLKQLYFLQRNKKL